MLEPGTTTEYSRYKLDDVVVSAFDFGGARSVLQSMELSFARIETGVGGGLALGHLKEHRELRTRPRCERRLGRPP